MRQRSKYSPSTGKFNRQLCELASSAVEADGTTERVLVLGQAEGQLQVLDLITKEEMSSGEAEHLSRLWTARTEKEPWAIMHFGFSTRSPSLVYIHLLELEEKLFRLKLPPPKYRWDRIPPGTERKWRDYWGL